MDWFYLCIVTLKILHLGGKLNFRVFKSKKGIEVIFIVNNNV